MRRVLLSVLIAGGFFVIAFQSSPVVNITDSVHSSIPLTQNTTLNPNIDPIQA